MRKNPENNNSSKKWLTPEVFGFGLTSFFSDLSHEIATALLPLFLASLGAPAYAIGLIEGLADGLANIGKLLGGWVSDRFGRAKSFALLGYLVTGLTQGLFAFVTFWPQALLARVAGWMGRGWRGPIRDKLFHESVTKEISGRAFGFERAFDTLGAVIAPLIVFLFLSQTGFRTLFLWTWVPGILAVLTFLIFVKERKVPHNNTFSLIQGIQKFSPDYKRFLLGVTLFGLGDFSHTILIYWAGVLMTPVYGFAKASSLAILLYVFHNIVYALASYPMGHLADRMGKFRILGLGYALAGLMFLGLAFAKSNFIFLAVIFLLGGFYIAIEDTLERAIAGDLLDREIKGTGYGVLASLNGLGDLLSSLIVGILLTFAPPVFAFGYCFVLSTIGAVIILRIKENR